MAPTHAASVASEPLPGVNLGNPLPHGRGSDSGNKGAAGPGDGVTKFFGVAAHGSRIVYVLDCSGSMGKNGAIVAAARELVRSVEQLPAHAQFQVIVYNAKPRFLLARYSGWLTASPQMTQEIEAAFNALPTEGKTEHGPALQKAIALQPDVLYFLTDADDLKQEHLRQTNLANRGRTVIHTIELTLANQHRVGMPMQLLARDNRGAYQAIDLENYR
ncbi:MAG: VWA domain-containing protein [Gemmataceae bacterium]|nr:VWA domain-containing protein [Gemmataceae bacterium]